MKWLKTRIATGCCTKKDFKKDVQQMTDKDAEQQELKKIMEKMNFQFKL